jgi:hypothetical protein
MFWPIWHVCVMPRAICGPLSITNIAYVYNAFVYTYCEHSLDLWDSIS